MFFFLRWRGWFEVFWVYSMEMHFLVRNDKLDSILQSSQQFSVVTIQQYRGRITELEVFFESFNSGFKFLFSEIEIK